MSYTGYPSSPRILQKRGPEERDVRQHDVRQREKEQRAVRRTPTVLFLAVCAAFLVLALPACGVSARPASIGDVKMATDKGGKHPTEVFSPDDTFYCLADLNNAPEDTTVRAVWRAADVKGVKADTDIKQMSAKGAGGRLRFALSSKSPWPTGKYEVELYLNKANKPTKTLAFEVR